LEEIIRGDRHDTTNAFQWSTIILNLPGTQGYRPALAWISKQRNDGSLASDFVCFVDDLRITGQGCQRVREAGHAISLCQSYLGIQDALQKLRSPGGTRRPGAWAGVNVCVEEDRGVVVLTSQEKLTSRAFTFPLRHGGEDETARAGSCPNIESASPRRRVAR